MGVFLSKPCVDKFSEDGEDDEILFGVSSMQGWRKNMEDAHLTVLDLGRAVGSSAVAVRWGDVREESKLLNESDKVRLFGVFDGHGGKEVALFVQEHLAQELVKLDAFKDGDFPSALVRSFHRMDELLEVAAKEMRRQRQVSPATGVSSIPGSNLGTVGGTGAGVGVGAGSGGAGAGAGAGGAEGGAGELGRGSTAGEDADEQVRGNEIMEKLNLYRARKNPSEIAAEEESNLEQSGRDSQGDEKDEKAQGVRLLSSQETGSQGPEGTPATPESNRPGDITFVPLREPTIPGSGPSTGDVKAGAREGVGPGEKIRMAEAIDLFQRIWHMGKDHGANRQPRDETARGGGDGSQMVAGPLGSARAGEAPSFTLLPDGNLTAEDQLGAAQRPGEEEQDCRDSGEDTFGDDETEEDDDEIGGSNGIAVGTGVRPPLAPNVASMVVGIDGPTCNLQDHPIQAGCTSVVCLMVGDTLHVANAGDSRAVMCRGVTALELSKDHKPLADGEKNRIEGAGGFVNAVGRVNGNLNLSRSIGDLKYKANSGLPPASQMITAEPDVRSIEVIEQDRFVVLACDGVWDCMSSQECVDFVGARLGKMNLSKICEEVMNYCVSDDPRRTQGIGGDNMTCIIVLLDKSLAGEQTSGSQQDTGGAVDETSSAL